MSAAVCLVLPQQQPQPQPQPQQVMLLNGYGGGEQGSEDSLEDSQQALLPQDKKSLSSMLAQRAMHERRLKPPDHTIPCPRCQSINTKFCYYNNYSLTQPRHFCKNCRRYWTAGGTLRNVPVGGGCRKTKRVKRNNADSSNTSSVDSSVCGFRSEAGNGGSPSVHQPFLQAPAGGSSTSTFYDASQFDEATKAAIARAQQVIRAGPPGVGHSSHESSPGSDGTGPGPGGPLGSSLTAQTFDSGIMAQGFFGSAAAKHEGGGVPHSNGDLSSIFEAHAYRAAAAGGQPLSDGMNGFSHHVPDVDAYGGGGHHVDTDGHHSHWRVQHKVAAEMWADEDHQHQHAQEREEVVPMPRAADHLRKASLSVVHGQAESLRHALKGKSSLCLSPSSGLDEEGSSPCSSVWAPANPNLNPYESTHDPGFNWPGPWTTPLDLMPPSAVQFGMRSEHLFDLPKSNLVNPVSVGFGLDEFHSADRKLA